MKNKFQIEMESICLIEIWFRVDIDRIDCCCQELKVEGAWRRNINFMSIASELLGGRYKRRFYILKIPSAEIGEVIQYKKESS